MFSPSIKNLFLFTTVLSIVLGLLVLIGWFTQTIVLIQVLPNFVPMQFNTALCFMLSGLTLFQIHQGKRRLSQVGGIIVGLIAGLTIIEYSAVVNIGLDELFMKHDITVETSHPGRMAPNTAFCFLLTSIAALLGTQTLKSIKMSGVLGVLIFGLGLVAFVGYMIGAEVGYGWGRLTRMAVHTAFGFMLLGVAFNTQSWLKEQKIKREFNIQMPAWLIAYAVVISVITLFADTKLPLGVASGLLYTLLVLFGWFFNTSRPTIVLAIVATILTIIGFFLSTDGSAIWMATTNRICTIIIVWLIAILLNSIKRKELSLIQLNRDLDRKVVESVAKNKELEQFAYIASHDLQEPLRTVQSFSQLLSTEYKDRFDETGQKSLEYIGAATVRMSNLIKGLLDYSRIGKERALSNVDCNVLLTEIRDDLSAMINETQGSISFDILPKIRGYETELRLLFQNLIINGLKFRDLERHPVIEISAKRVGSFWQFTVKDNGIGIAEEHTEKIFSIFQRLHDKESYEGTGIGLAHCRKIVELHAGQIWVESQVGQGSVFYANISMNLT